MRKNGYWWDKLAKPQYGGEIAFRTTRNIVNWDPYFADCFLRYTRHGWKN